MKQLHHLIPRLELYEWDYTLLYCTSINRDAQMHVMRIDAIACHDLRMQCMHTRI